MGDNSQISIWLFDTLECIGVSQRMRQHYKHNSKTMEVLHKIWSKGMMPCFIFGSSSEGTTSLGLNSDVDMVYPYDRMTIFDHIENCPATGLSILMINDIENSPGYVRLQLVINRKTATKDDLNQVPLELKNLLEEDKFGRLVFGCRSIFDSMNELDMKAFRHGPAVTTEMTEYSNSISLDVIYAYRFDFWPSVANDWIERKRQFGWPSPNAIKELQNYGFFLVYVGHPNSDENDLECRTSFSLQERQLMYELNETQYKCYVFLKMVNKDLIKPVVGDCITSYQLKTCLFYTIETNSQDIWRPDNLWNCIILCLNLLLEWVCNRFCPNYFIPKENMFLGKVEADIGEMMQAILGQLIEDGPKFLHRIKTDNIGKYFSYMEDDFETIDFAMISAFTKTLNVGQALIEACKANQLLNIYLNILHELLTEYEDGEETLTPMSHKNTCRVALAHLKLLNRLDKISNVTEYTIDETKRALDILKPFLRTSLACHYACLALQCEDEKRKNYYMANSDQQFKLGLMSDLTSSRLKYATFLFQLGEYEQCEEQLYIVEKQCKNCIIPMSNQRVLGQPAINEEVLMEIENPVSIDLKDCSSFPVIFLPTERVIVPDGLIFEMFRSCGVPPDSRSKFLDFWYDWAMVDSKTYLYFLWYLLDKKTGKPAVNYMQNVFRLYDNLNSIWSQSHRETTYNLIAWILASENKFPQAFDALKMSVIASEDFKLGHDKELSKAYVKHHNAAKWHMLLMLNKFWKLKGQNGDCI